MSGDGGGNEPVDTLKVARELAEGNVFSQEQSERLSNAFATYYDELRFELVTRAHPDARFAEFGARMDARFAESDARTDARFAESAARTDARFGETDARFAELDGRMEERFDGIYARLEGFESKVEARLAVAEANAEKRSAQLRAQLLASQVALFVLLGTAILLK